MYETQLLDQFADTDATKEFFACLDHNLNKVNKFYRTKEKEFLDRGESLKKQMDILVELKSAFIEKKGKGSSCQYSKEEESVSSTFSISGTYSTLACLINQCEHSLCLN